MAYEWTEADYSLFPGERDWIDLLRNTVAKGSTPRELQLFIHQCNRTGLDPLTRQIYAIRRKEWDADTRGYLEKQSIQISIDGFRVLAERTEKYRGQTVPEWCGNDGVWVDVWLKKEPPAAARCGVIRSDFSEPLYAVALYDAYVQTKQDGTPTGRWKTDPAGMLLKCAESLALRKAFPNDMSGLYGEEEMGSVDNPQIVSARAKLPEPKKEIPENATAGVVQDGINGYPREVVEAVMHEYGLDKSIGVTQMLALSRVLEPWNLDADTALTWVDLYRTHRELDQTGQGESADAADRDLVKMLNELADDAPLDEADELIPDEKVE